VILSEGSSPRVIPPQTVRPPPLPSASQADGKLGVNRIKTLRAILIILLCLLGVAAIVLTSQRFQSCIGSASSHLSAPDLYDKAADFLTNLLGYRRCAGAYMVENNAAITALATVLVAIFTAILGSFTISLAGSTRIAAEAARTSAISAERALEQTSSPYLDVSIALKDAVIHRMPGGATVTQFMGGEFAEYVIHNYGQATAIVLEIYQFCVRSGGIPGPIPFPPLQSPTLKRVFSIGGQNDSAPVPVSYPEGGIQDLKGSQAVWIGVQIRYRDVFRNQYLSSYCAAFNAHSATFAAYGGREYNERRKLTDEEVRVAEARDA
jgi:hypothetical protein